MNIHFSDFFEVTSDSIEDYGAFNISLINDLPLFIDPFLLFNSSKPMYQKLHEGILNYIIFLKNKSVNSYLDEGLINRWFRFKEVRQNWFGYSLNGNKGKGLGIDFAHSLVTNFKTILKSFGNETITQSSHLEKLTLIKDGIGRDAISDFTVNLIKEFLLDYTQEFTVKFIDEKNIRLKTIDKVRFNYQTQSWTTKQYKLPWFIDDYVILTPKDILTKDENWINKNDLYDDFESIIESIDNNELRAQVNNYFLNLINPSFKKRDYEWAVDTTIQNFPGIIDYYIKYKEDNAEEAHINSDIKISDSKLLYITNPKSIAEALCRFGDFYKTPQTTLQETYTRIMFFKSFIEDNDGYKLLYHEDKPIKNEHNFQLLFKLIWYASPSDFNSEVNNGRGPVDFKISRGNYDKTLVEFKLATNSHLKNFIKQVEVYEKANKTKQSYKVILFFSDAELEKVNKTLVDLDLNNNEFVILIDARDNKKSASIV